MMQRFDEWNQENNNQSIVGEMILPYIGANIDPTKNSPKPRFRGINLQISQ